MIETDKIYNMDCLEGMSRMPEGSVDAIIADLPYGVLNRGNRSACGHLEELSPLRVLSPLAALRVLPLSFDLVRY